MRRRRNVATSVMLLAAVLVAAARWSIADPPSARLATQPADFRQPGTQPSATLDNFGVAAAICQDCHGGYLASDNEPWDAWIASMMAQAARDPVMRAAATLANADAAGAGETCIRCHAPIGWLAGRSTGGDFASLQPADFDGIACNVCHRLVDPIARAGAPVFDAPILAALDQAGTRPPGTCRDAPAVVCGADADCGSGGRCEVDAGGGRFVVDPDDHRRGPFAIGLVSHATVTSPYHRSADVCAPCHDVSTPTFTRQPDGTFVLNDLGAPHPTQRPQDMFPEQRTFSEWRASDFARGGVVFADGRFGGALTAVLPNTVPVSTCQDCHMPDAVAPGCGQVGPRPDMPTHGFAGANTWVLGAVLADAGVASGLDDGAVARAEGRTAQMLAAAADVDASQAGTALRVRVVNQTGHKLPTGYPEGRRMWLQVRFFAGEAPTPLAVDGAYDAATATLGPTTKIYETRHALDGSVAAATGLAPGTEFHLVLSNQIVFDDRIPPRGFTNAAFAAAGAAPAGYAYADGQHWDDTSYPIPPHATRAEVTLWYQTTSREYAEFLRDQVAGESGTKAYALWVAGGRSTPVAMATASVPLDPDCISTSGPCCGPPAGTTCDDADACTTNESCTGGICAGTITGNDAIRCELTRIAAPGICTTALPHQLRSLIAKRVRKARTLLAAADRKADNPTKSTTLRQRAARVLDPLTTHVQAAVATKASKRHLPGECATALQAALTRALSALRAD